MSEADSTWPVWLRRHTGVERLGSPSPFFARLTIALWLLTIVFVGAWNAAKYPVALGYDASSNADYMHILLDEHHIPRPDQSGEANQPPAYYAVGGVAARLGLKIFHWTDTKDTKGFNEQSYRGAQYLNIVLAFLTALCVLWLAWVVAPGRPWVWATSVAFFAFVPVVSKTEAMVHPENLSMLTSAAALAATAHMLVRRTFSRWILGLLALSIGIGLATRTTMVFTVLAILVGVGAALTIREIRERVPWRAVAIVSGAVVALALPWVVYRAAVHHQGPLNQTSRLLHAALHPGRHSLSDTFTSHRRFFTIWEPGVFRDPWRSNYKNEALPQTYTDIWGDWFGVMAWSGYAEGPNAVSARLLKDQSYIGVVPTALAIAGWLWLCWTALRRRRELVLLTAMPVFGVGGYLYRSWLGLTHDGDLFKATYALNTVAVWALAFALATAWIGSRSRLARYGMSLLFVAFAILELRFILYGIRDSQPIF